ncbi:MAG: glycosyltransferase family 4 protein [Dehalococcoidia bacterium]
MLNYEYPPLGGGAANACKYILGELARKQIEVDLVTSAANDKFEQEKIGDTVTLYKLPVNKKDIHYWTQKEILSYTLKATKFMRRLMKDNHYDVCHAFFGIPCGAMAYLFKRRLSYIVSLRGSDVPGFNKRFSAEYVVLKPIIKEVWRRSASVVANSQGLKELALRSDPKRNIDIIYNGIDTAQFIPGSGGGDKVKILCVSRLIGRKGISHLIESAPIIKEKYNGKFEISIVGEGNLEQELRALSASLGADDVVSFAGYVEHSKLPEIYAGSDIFILPSMNEGMSNTVLEAMACGLPIITTDTGGTRELIKDNGIVLSEVSGAAIADAVLRLMTDDKARREMGRKSRELAEGLSWEKVAESYLRMYETIKL